MVNIVCSGKGADVNVGKLGDTKTVESFGQARQGDTWPNDFHIETTMEEAVPRSNEWRGADQNSGLRQEMTAARRHWVGDGGTSTGDAPFRALACFAVRPRCDTGRTLNSPESND